MGCGSSSDVDSRPRVRYFAGPEFLEIESKLLKKKRNVGICFSGGGARSAMLTLGYLRALRELQYLRKVRYVSCVSGASWAVIPWMYKQDITDGEFLGKCHTPETLKLSHLKQEEGAYPTTLAYEISRMPATEDVAGYLCSDIRTPDPGEGKWKEMIGDTFLKPFNCDYNAYFSWTFRLAELISERNIISTTLREFQVPDSPKPYTIVTSLLVKNDHTREKIPFEFTPVLSGCPVTDEDSMTISGYVETFGFDQRLAKVVDDKYCYIKTVKENMSKKEKLEKTQGKKKKKKGLVFPFKKFSLREMISSSSSCLAEMFASFDRVEDLIFCHEYNSNHLVYSPEMSDQTELFPFIDGGWVDNLGILCQLRRRVKNIICFVNTKFPVTEKLITIEIEALFLKNSPVQVFKDSGQLRTLKSTLLRLKRQGKPLVCRGNYLVLDNEFYQIDGGWYCNVLWVYNDKCKKFVDELLDPELQAMVMTDPRFKRFPRYKTALENPPNLLGLHEQQGNLLSHLAYYTVHQCFDLFEKQMDSVPMREGDIQLSSYKPKPRLPPTQQQQLQRVVSPPAMVYQQVTPQPQIIQPVLYQQPQPVPMNNQVVDEEFKEHNAESDSSDDSDQLVDEEKAGANATSSSDDDKNSDSEEEKNEDGKIVEESSSDSEKDEEKEEKEGETKKDGDDEVEEKKEEGEEKVEEVVEEEVVEEIETKKDDDDEEVEEKKEEGEEVEEIKVEEVVEEEEEVKEEQEVKDDDEEYIEQENQEEEVEVEEVEKVVSEEEEQEEKVVSEEEEEEQEIIQVQPPVEEELKIEETEETEEVEQQQQQQEEETEEVEGEEVKNNTEGD